MWRCVTYKMHRGVTVWKLRLRPAVFPRAAPPHTHEHFYWRHTCTHTQSMKLVLLLHIIV